MAKQMAKNNERYAKLLTKQDRHKKKVWRSIMEFLERKSKEVLSAKGLDLPPKARRQIPSKKLSKSAPKDMNNSDHKNMQSFGKGQSSFESPV